VRSLLNSDASALLRYEGGQFIPLAIDGLMQDVLGRRFALKDHPRLEAIARAGMWCASLPTAPCPTPMTA
jgi:anaerobic nitric oxide reductase transcription regulator